MFETDCRKPFFDAVEAPEEYRESFTCRYFSTEYTLKTTPDRKVHELQILLPTVRTNPLDYSFDELGSSYFSFFIIPPL